MDNNINSIELQQFDNFENSNFFHKKALLRALLDYEYERKASERTFDIYDFVGEILGHTPGTIRKFFNKFDRTGVKLGTEDLLRICIILGTDAPIIALLEDFKTLVNPSRKDMLPNKKITAIKDNTLKVAKKVGDLSGNVSEALEDNRVDVSEKEAILKNIDDLRTELDAVEQQIKG